MNSFEFIYGPGFEADMASLKSKMVILLVARLREKCKTRKEMCELLNCSQAQISNIMTGKLGSLSFERVAKFLYAFDVKACAQLHVVRGEVKSVSINLGDKL
ncbi:TPA: helix-turn-helix domain-containing protein [Enterobacter hormaechei]